MLNVWHRWFWIQECKQAVIGLKIHGGVLAARRGVLQVGLGVKHLRSRYEALTSVPRSKQASQMKQVRLKKYTISEKMGNTVRMQNTLSGCWGHLQIPTGHLSDLGRQPAGKVLDSPTWVPTQKPDGYGAAIEPQCTEDRIRDSPKQARAVRKKTASSSRALPQSIR